MKDYKHIIWDWNGTLLDDAWLCVEIMNRQLAGANLPAITLEDYAELFRFPVKAYYADLGFDFDQTTFETLSDAFIIQYEARKRDCLIRPEGVALIEKFAAGKIPQSIISAAEQNSLTDITRHYGVYQYFQAVRGLSNHHAFGKLEIGKQWVVELGLPPDEILMIGDTLHDFELTQQLGIDCVLVYSGHQSKARLAASGVPVIDALSELEDTLI